MVSITESQQPRSSLRRQHHHGEGEVPARRRVGPRGLLSRQQRDVEDLCRRGRLLGHHVRWMVGCPHDAGSIFTRMQQLHSHGNLPVSRLHQLGGCPVDSSMEKSAQRTSQLRDLPRKSAPREEIEKTRPRRKRRGRMYHLLVFRRAPAPTPMQKSTYDLRRVSRPPPGLGSKPMSSLPPPTLRDVVCPRRNERVFDRLFCCKLRYRYRLCRTDLLQRIVLLGDVGRPAHSIHHAAHLVGRVAIPQVFARTG